MQDFEFKNRKRISNVSPQPNVCAETNGAVGWSLVIESKETIR